MGTILAPRWLSAYQFHVVQRAARFALAAAGAPVSHPEALRADHHGIHDRIEHLGHHRFTGLFLGKENQKKQNSKIKRITIKGTNEAGQFEIDTDLMKMKHYLSVKGVAVTNEVDSYDFFSRAQEFIDETRNKQ